MRISDWSSDVCSSDLSGYPFFPPQPPFPRLQQYDPTYSPIRLGRTPIEGVVASCINKKQRGIRMTQPDPRLADRSAIMDLNAYFTWLIDHRDGNGVERTSTRLNSRQ